MLTDYVLIVAHEGLLAQVPPAPSHNHRKRRILFLAALVVKGFTFLKGYW